MGWLTFRGRKNRMQYWQFIVMVIAAYVACSIFSGGNEIVLGIFGIVIAWSSLSNIIRRLHDFNRSGWWWILACIPYVGWIIAVAIGLIKGTDGDNDYGPEP